MDWNRDTARDPPSQFPGRKDLSLSEYNLISSPRDYDAMTNRCDRVLTDVQLPEGRIADISIRDGRVVHVGSPLASPEHRSCRGMRVLPGAVDLHVHMRDGEQRHKEDWRSGSMSALAGGVTVVVDQPNTVPPLDLPQRVRKRVDLAKKTSFCHFAINGGAASGGALAGMWREGVLAFGEIFTGASSYAEAVDPGETIAFATQAGAVTTLHAEEVADGPDESLADHYRLRNPAGEARAIRRISRGASPESRLHFCHVSCSLAIREARGTVEATPHHLLLSCEDFDPRDGRGKVNPPLRTRKEQEALLSHWDRIDTIGSDHAPHSIEEKDSPFPHAPSGFPGVETMVPLLLALVEEGRIPLSGLIERTSRNPSRIMGIPPAGFSPGDRADFAIYPRQTTRIDAVTLHSRACWTPFEGMDAIFPGEVLMSGKTVFRDGDFFPGNPVWFHGRGYHLPPHT
jgi:dihydroorotase